AAWRSPASSDSDRQRRPTYPTLLSQEVVINETGDDPDETHSESDEHGERDDGQIRAAEIAPPAPRCLTMRDEQTHVNTSPVDDSVWQYALAAAAGEDGASERRHKQNPDDKYAQNDN